jgi:hypothetical protein
MFALHVNEVELKIKAQWLNSTLVQAPMGSLRLFKHDQRGARNLNAVLEEQASAGETVD